MKKILLLSGCIMFALAACGPDDEPKPGGENNNPTPEKVIKACFTPSKTLVDSGEAVTFTNCSENASAYFWTFGSGPQSTDQTPTPRVYGERKTYAVKLKASNADGTKFDDTTVSITVGYRQLTSIVINKFKTTKTVGGQEVAWDEDNSAPDLYVVFGPGNSGVYKTNVVPNASGKVTLNIDPALRITSANNSGWTFRLYDEDNGGLFDIMTTSGTAYPSRGGGGSIKLSTASAYDIDLIYTVVK